MKISNNLNWFKTFKYINSKHVNKNLSNETLMTKINGKSCNKKKKLICICILSICINVALKNYYLISKKH